MVEQCTHDIAHCIRLYLTKARRNRAKQFFFAYSGSEECIGASLFISPKDKSAVYIFMAIIESPLIRFVHSNSCKIG